MHSLSLKTILVYLIIGILNVLGTKSFTLSLFLTVFEYAVVFFFIIRRQYYEALVAFLAFTSLSLEINAYIYLDGEGTFARYHFLNPPFFGEILYDFIIVFLYLFVYKQFRPCGQMAINGGSKFLKWLWFLAMTGAVSILIGIALNDNHIINTGWYPKLAFSLLFKFIAFILFCISFYCIAVSESRERLENDVLSILIGVACVSVLSVLIGYHGYYGDNESIMLAPLAVCFTPTLLLFSFGTIRNRLFIVLIVVSIIALALSHSIVIGSKWYFILSITFIYYITKEANIKSFWSFLFVALIVLLLIPILSEWVKSLLNLSEFDSFKLDQSVKFLNIFSNNSIYDWFLNLDESARFRIDEPINIIHEYINKPGYILMGKGFGGVTPHYTSFCIWDTPSAFTEGQRLYGLYYSMHETFSVLLLRHGLVGLVFFISVLINLFKRWYSPWVVLALIWFLFYWSFGISFRIGVVALVLAITVSSNNRANGENCGDKE